MTRAGAALRLWPWACSLLKVGVSPFGRLSRRRLHLPSRAFCASFAHKTALGAMIGGVSSAWFADDTALGAEGAFQKKDVDCDEPNSRSLKCELCGPYCCFVLRSRKVCEDRAGGFRGFSFSQSEELRNWRS